MNNLKIPSLLCITNVANRVFGHIDCAVLQPVLFYVVHPVDKILNVDYVFCIGDLLWMNCLSILQLYEMKPDEIVLIYELIIILFLS